MDLPFRKARKKRGIIPANDRRCFAEQVPVDELPASDPTHASVFIAMARAASKSKATGDRSAAT